MEEPRKVVFMFPDGVEREMPNTPAEAQQLIAEWMASQGHEMESDEDMRDLMDMIGKLASGEITPEDCEEIDLEGGEEDG